MYADYIEHQGGDENSIISAEHIDVLTFNRIDFEKLSEMQKRIIGKVHSRLTAFEEENADMISSYLKSYSINGTSMEFGASWEFNVYQRSGNSCRPLCIAKINGTLLSCNMR